MCVILWHVAHDNVGDLPRSIHRGRDLIRMVQTEKGMQCYWDIKAGGIIAEDATLRAMPFI